MKNFMVQELAALLMIDDGELSMEEALSMVFNSVTDPKLLGR
jgi:hypothetical protein